jgi:hypothetical protein
MLTGFKGLRTGPYGNFLILNPDGFKGQLLLLICERSCDLATMQQRQMFN